MARQLFAFMKNMSGDQLGAIVLVCAFVVIFSFINHDVWYFVVSAMIGYLAADIIINFFVGGERGTIRIPLLGHSERRGHAYIAYYVGIIITTFLSAAATSYLLTLAETSFPESVLAIRILVSVVISVLVFVDFYFRYYERWFREDEPSQGW
ncbi:MAG: hypothetical protein V1813_02475 [Candidatus Aenigmatarchaeota archaeon]